MTNTETPANTYPSIQVGDRVALPAGFSTEDEFEVMEISGDTAELWSDWTGHKVAFLHWLTKTS